jgi:hypothetical protein
MADPFIGRFREFEGGLTVEGPLHQVFPLFSPEGERAWVPGWDPELLHPRDTPWAEGQIFRTREERGEAIWIVTRLQRSDYRVEYHRVEPGRYVARVRVACADAGAGVTVVLTSYAFLGLSEAGNQDIASMTEEDYAQKMRRWKGWIAEHMQQRRQPAG